MFCIVVVLASVDEAISRILLGAGAREMNPVVAYFVNRLGLKRGLQISHHAGILILYLSTAVGPNLTILTVIQVVLGSVVLVNLREIIQCRRRELPLGSIGINERYLMNSPLADPQLGPE
jgi:hypothetical protein